MTIKEIKEKYKDYRIGTGEHNSFVIDDYKGEKIVIVVNINRCKLIGEYVMQVVRVSDGKELLKDGACRPCDDLKDAIDVAMEMIEE